MAKLRLYFSSLWKYWWALMSCAVFTLIGVIVLWFDKTNRWALGATFVASIVLLLVASYLAWLDQYHKANPNESIDSLRRRTVKLTDEIEQFARLRFADRCRIISVDPIDNGEFQRLTRAHDQETAAMFAVKYRAALMGIIQELKSKGVYWLEYDLGKNNYPNDIREFQALRSMAYRLDCNDAAIRFQGYHGIERWKNPKRRYRNATKAPKLTNASTLRCPRY